jgi:hypothetical protein
VNHSAAEIAAAIEDAPAPDRRGRNEITCYTFVIQPLSPAVSASGELCGRLATRVRQGEKFEPAFPFFRRKCYHFAGISGDLFRKKSTWKIHRSPVAVY